MTVEWLGGTDDAEELPQPPRRPSPRRPLWWLAGGLVAAVAVVAAVVSRSDTGPKAAAPPIAPSTSTSAPFQPVELQPSTQPAPLPGSYPVVMQLGHSLLPGASGWELFARSDEAVIRIQVGSGRVTTTPLPAVLDEGGVAFVTGPDSVIVRPNDAVPGYLIPDGRPALALPSLFANANNVLAGPQRDEVWVQGTSDTGQTTAPSLFDLRTNRVVGEHLTVPSQLVGPLTSDGSGYLLYTGVGGIYDVRDTGVHRVTSGRIVAVGSSSWLVLDCDEQYHCGLVLVDQQTGLRTSVGAAPIAPDYLPGLISPDGRFAVYLADTGRSTESLRIVDLVNRTDQLLAVHPANVSFDTQPFVWAPTGHVLLIADNDEKLEQVDPATLATHVVDPRLPRVIQLAIRVLS
jgi:hypothetical protein